MRAALLCAALFAGAEPQSSPAQSSRAQSSPSTAASRAKPLIFVQGAVVKPGSRPVMSGYTLLDLFMDTPVEEGADLNRVLVVRPDKTNPLVLEVDVRNIIMTGITTSNIELRDGDIVYVLR